MLTEQLDIPGILVKIKETWHYQYYEPRPDGRKGVKRRRTTGETDYNLALAAARRIHSEIALLKDSHSDSRLLDAAAIREIRWTSENSSGERTWRVTYCLENFVKFAGNISIDDITTDMLARYQRYRVKQPKMINKKKNGKWVREPAKDGTPTATATINLEIGYVIRMLKHNGILTVHRPPALPVNEEHRGRPFKAEELVKFFEACDRFPQNDPGRYKPLFLLMLCTGARPAELIPTYQKKLSEEERRKRHKPLLKSEVNYEHGIVNLRSCKKKPGVKRNDATPYRVVPFVLDLVKKVAEQTPGPHVFSKFPIKNYFDRILKLAGLDKVDELGEKLTAHSFRHTYGTIQAEAGVEAFVLQNLMRHKDPRMTARYTQRALKGAAVINPLILLDSGSAGTQSVLLPPPPKEVESDQE